MSITCIHVILLDHVGDDLGVGLGRELVAFFGKLSLQRNVVLDDAVVHDDNPARAVAMRMSVFFCRTTVRSPSRVADAVSSIERLKPDDFFQVAKFTLGTADLQAFTVATDRDPGRIVAAILQSPETIKNDGNDPLLANIPNNSAHAADSYLICGEELNANLRCLFFN